MNTNYDLIINGIRALGVNHVFVYPGHSIIALLDKLALVEDIRTVVCSCEQEAVAAADAYGRFKGAGVAMVTYGAGSLSVVNQVGNAVVSRSPLWIISGRPSEKERSGRFVWSSIGDINAYINVFRDMDCTSYPFDVCADDKLGTMLTHMKFNGKPFYTEIDPEFGTSKAKTTDVSLIDPKAARREKIKEEQFTYWITDKLSNFDLPGPLDLSQIPKQRYDIGKNYLTYDVGEPSFAASQLVPHLGITLQDVLSPLPWASMGFAIPAAIGVAFATRQPIIAVTGDGSFRLSMLSLSTINRYDLPVKIILIDNDGFETEKLLSDAAQHAPYNALYDVNYADIVIAMGLHLYTDLKDLLESKVGGVLIMKMKGPSARMKDFSEKTIRSVIE